MKEETTAKQVGEYIGWGLYACFTPSVVDEYVFDYMLFKNGNLIFKSPIVKMIDICQDCRNLTAGRCYKHKIIN